MNHNITLFRNLFILLALNLAADSQDIHFSQFYETPLLRNPALAGIFSGDVRMESVYRNQWQNNAVPYQTGSFSSEFKLPIGKTDDFITLGGEILYDKAGSIALTATHVLPAINYHKSLSHERNMYISLGFMAGIVQRSLDRNKITTNNQFDGNGFNGSLSNGETFSRASYTYFDGSTGMSFNSQVGDNKNNNMYLAIAYQHFNKPSNISFYSNPDDELRPKWVYSGGLKMSTSIDSYIGFQADYSTQGPYTELIAGTMFTKDLDDIDNPKYLIDAGVFLRWQNAAIPVIKLEAKPLAISFSYDIVIAQSAFATNSNGAFEMALTYQKYFDHNPSKNALRCPKF
jgi:type IX secretion system PorP/SprF family membrane protein